MNATLNLQTDVTDWLRVGARINFSRKHFSAPTLTITCISISGAGAHSSSHRDTDGQDYRVIAMQKQASRSINVTDRTRLNAYVKANITKDLTLNADYTLRH